VLLLATPDGNEGRSTLPDVLPPGHPGARIVRSPGLVGMPHRAQSSGVTACSFAGQPCCPGFMNERGVSTARAGMMIPLHSVPTVPCRAPHYPAKVGTVVFNGQVVYTSAEHLAADEPRHRVGPDSPYAWAPGVWRSATVMRARG
jgi:hypothetical protein